MDTGPWDQKLPALLMAKLMLRTKLWLPVDLLTRRPPGEELPEETSGYVKGLQERLTEVHHQVRGALEFSGEVMKHSHDVKASQVCYKDGVKVWL
ncbi:hypothetical protein Hamer_G008176 [Homarus americanus]|uniref:Uncharacterized protein n=1 Tax=Homarus americanus TaxID=6706 RepID=A0A8J5TME8_HOMAM|nr:hypothetical protein Hamer_G008176 [Homarus americanus]